METKNSPIRLLFSIIGASLLLTMGLSCDLWSSQSPDQYITFLPEDREWEMSLLDPVSEWEGTGEDKPEWQFSELSEDYPADNPLGFHIFPQHDSDGSKSADITYLKDLGTDFRLDFTFRPLGTECLGPHVELMGSDGMVKLIVTSIEDTESSKVKIILEVLERTSTDTYAFTSIHRVERAGVDSFNPALWLTLYIDMDSGNNVTIDIDERDGNEDSYDDDILEFSHLLFTESVSHSFEDPVFRSPCAALEWAGLGNPNNYWIGDIHYRDCSDGIWPDPHTL